MHEGPRHRAGRRRLLRTVRAGIVLALLLGPAAPAAAQDGAVRVNANWQVFPMSARIAVSPTSVTFPGLDPQAFTAAERAAIARQSFFHLGRSRPARQGTRFLLVGLPKALCTASAGGRDDRPVRASVVVQVDGRVVAELPGEARCGKPFLVEEAFVGDALSAVAAAFRRGRQALATILLDGRSRFAYAFDLSGFSEAIGVLERQGR